MHPISITYTLRLISACSKSPRLFTDLYDILQSHESSLAQDASNIIGDDVIVHGENVHARNQVVVIPGRSARVTIPPNTHGVAIRNGSMLTHRTQNQMYQIKEI